MSFLQKKCQVGLKLVYLEIWRILQFLTHLQLGREVHGHILLKSQRDAEINIFSQ